MKLENILRPIKSDSIEGHEKELQNKMIEIELQYVDKLFLKKIPPLCEDLKVDNIHDLVSKYTEIPPKIMEYQQGKSNEEELLVLVEKILNNISDLYHKDHEHWIEKIEELVGKELEKYKNLEKKENQDINYNNLENKAGLIGFGMETNLGHLLPNSGISDEDFCLQIHFEDFYKQQKGDIKNLFSSNSLEKLALKIVDEYPETKAIVAKSWLIDTPLAKRIGFTVYNRDFDIKGFSGTFWGQFINSNGQIKSDEVSKFLETGKPKYRTAAGAIMVENFLKKYLPEDRRGKIILKEVKPGLEEFNEQLKKEGKIFESILANLDKISEEEIEKKIFECEIINGFLKTKHGEGFIELIKGLKRRGKSAEDIKNENLLIKYKKSINEYINKLKFTDKEVII